MVIKQSWIRKNWQIFSIGLLIVFALFILYYTNTTSYICSESPEKCVCEEYYCKPLTFKGSTFLSSNQTCYFQKSPNKIFEFGCNKFRLKTQAELLEQSCQENPREDEDCKCEEIRYY